NSTSTSATRSSCRAACKRFSNQPSGLEGHGPTLTRRSIERGDGGRGAPRLGERYLLLFAVQRHGFHVRDLARERRFVTEWQRLDFVSAYQEQRAFLVCPERAGDLECALAPDDFHFRAEGPDEARIEL